MSRRHVVPMAMILLLVTAIPRSVQAVQSYSEDFTTTTFKDTLNTTADWDTTAAMLRLPPFTSTLTGLIDTPFDAVSVAVAGDLAYIADGVGGLQVIDITDPANPVQIGALDTAGAALDIALAGDIACVAAGEAGLQIIDITTPGTPLLIDTCDTPSSAQGVAIAGDLVLVADDDRGLQIIDITDPAHPAIIGAINTPDSALDIAVAGNYALIADGDSGLQVIDITDPAHPAGVGTIDTPGTACGITLAGDLACVADGASGLRLFDITDPTLPVPIGTCDTPGAALGVGISGDLVLVAMVGGLGLVDIDDPTQPQLFDTFTTTDRILNVAVAGDHAFAAGGANGLQIVRIRQLMDFVRLGFDITPVGAFGLTRTGDLAIVADYPEGLRIIDCGDPTDPELLSTFTTSGESYNVVVSGDLALVADGAGGLQVIDIGDPADPTLTGTCATPGQASDVAVAGDLAFVADYTNGLQVIDIGDPADPVIIGSLDLPGFTRYIEVAGDLAFVTNSESGFGIIDISIPTNPISVGGCTTPGDARNLAVAGDLVYVADWLSGLQVIDISQPASPAAIGNCVTGGSVRSVALAGDIAYVANESSGLQLIDISDPVNPELANAFATPGNARDVVAAGDLVYIADWQSGMQVVQIYQHEVLVVNGSGRSLPVDDSADTILLTSLTSTEVNDVNWELSADGGEHWQHFSPSGAWIEFTMPGTDLMWRTTHTWTQGVNPSVSALTLRWLCESAGIGSITDVPADQGGRVLIHLARSAYDFATTSTNPVTGYNVWLRVDDIAARGTILREGTTAADNLFGGAEPILKWRGRSYLVHPAGERGDMPAGLWANVGDFPALQQQEYGFIAETAADSTAANGAPAVYCITAHTADPVVWFASQPDSGWSVDNIAPGVPGNFRVDHTAEEGASLTWDPCAEEDFQYFRIYRGLTGDFEIGPESLIHETVGTGWLDAAGAANHVYKLTALDHTGNESEPVSSEEVPVLLSGILLLETTEGVRISWTSTGLPGRSWVLERERSNGSGHWINATRLPGVIAAETAQVTWLDDTVEAGQRYRYSTLLLGDNQWTERYWLGEIAPRGSMFADRLLGVWPNPCNPTATIAFELSREVEVELTVYSINGRLVRNLVKGKLPAGPRQVVWNGCDDQGRPLPSGVYLARILARGFSDTRRVVLLK
ncbi:MAG: T9SS type A sorting domain-containing protein [bacterium]|nr:T9SS type A sorting domain-containing protein [bacterium]